MKSCKTKDFSLKTIWAKVLEIFSEKMLTMFLWIELHFYVLNCIFCRFLFNVARIFIVVSISKNTDVVKYYITSIIPILGIFTEMELKFRDKILENQAVALENSLLCLFYFVSLTHNFFSRKQIRIFPFR